MRRLLVERALACNGGFSPRPAFPSAGPSVLPRSRRQSRHNRIVHNIPRGLRHLLPVPHPTIVGLPLPKRLAGLPDKQIGLASGPAFDPSQQLTGIDQRPNENMDVVGHNDPGVEIAPVVLRFGRADSRADHVGDVRPAQLHRSFTSRIEVSIHPDESLTRGRMIRRRVARLRQAPVQAPGHEQGASFGMPVGQAAGRNHVNCSVVRRAGFSLQRGLQPPFGPGLKPRLQAKARSTRSLQAEACSTRR
jgi:hypothetical protein